MATQVDTMFSRLEKEKSQSFLKQHLTEERFDSLKNAKTQFGGTLADCIRPGCENPENPIGVVATDPDAYRVFSPLFHSIIKDFNSIKTLNHPRSDFGPDNLNLSNLDPDGKIIVSIRFCFKRNIDGFGFLPTMSKEDLISVEDKVLTVAENLENGVRGAYIPIAGLTKEQMKQQFESYAVFNDNKFMTSAGAYQDWPFGRGVFSNQDKNLTVLLNKEDHLQIDVMQKGSGDLEDVYRKTVKVLKIFENNLKFIKHPDYGYLTMSPANVGSAFKAFVNIKIPKFAASPHFGSFLDNFYKTFHHLGVQKSSHGVEYEISIKRCYGLTEFEACMELNQGLKTVIEEERRLV